MSTLQRGRGAGAQSGTTPQGNGELPHPSLSKAVTMAWVGALGLALLWICQSRPQIWQEWKGHDEYPGREGGREEAVAVASSEHLRKGRGVKQGSQAFFSS